ncbi:hypothetical protein BH23CHL5_BH23CHL5_27930 [soil metagenome]
MSVCACARCSVLQHAFRVLSVAVLFAAILLNTVPAAALQSMPSRISIPEPQVETLAVARGGFNVIRPKLAPSKTLMAPSTLAATLAPAAPLGSTIAGTAMAYVGYPYVAAGAGPSGFDCSGFTQFIIAVTTGIWIPHAVEAQPWAAGHWVDYGSWLPGDLIYFQNTYRAGISHAAIYIGDGLIVHAENYGSGVTIDSIYSSYYGPRYWGAIRIG